MAGRIIIPPYQPTGVRTEAVPGGGYIRVDASAGDFGQSLAAGLKDLGKGLAGATTEVDKAQLERRARDSEAVVKSADSKALHAEQALLFDPAQGYFASHGRDAVERADAVLSAYAGMHAREAAALTDDEQRRMFAEISPRRQADFAQRVERHRDAERLRWHDDAGDERIALAQADAGLHWSDDARVSQAIGTARVEVRDKAERHGWDAERTRTALAHETSRAARAAIEAAVERDHGRAQVLFLRYEPHLEERDRAGLEGLLDEARLRWAAAEASEAIRKGLPLDANADTPRPPINPRTGAPPLDWQIGQAEAIADPATRARTVERLRSADAAAEAAAEASARERGERVLSRVMKDKLTDASTIPLCDWAELDDERRRAIEALLEHNLRGDEPAPDPILFDALVSQMTRDPRAFAQRDLVPLAARLPQAQWQRLRDWQAGIQRDDRATEDQIYAIKRGLQIGGRMLSDVDPTDAATRRMALIEEIDTWRRINGKSPDDADITGMLARRVPAAPHMTQTLEWDPRVGTESTQLRFVPPLARPGDRSDIHLAQVEPEEPAEGRRGIAPQTEPAPGSPVFQNARVEANKIVNPGRRLNAPEPEPAPGSWAFRTAMAQLKAITDPGLPSEPHPGSPEFQNATAALELLMNPGRPVVLPNGEKVPSDEPDRPPDLMSPVADLSVVAKAGRITGAKIKIKLANRPWEILGYAEELVGQALAQGGQFDYQRAPSPDGAPDYVQLRQFRDVSNFNVGLFMQQTRLFLDVSQVLFIAGEYAKKHSSNYMPKERYGLDPRVKRWIERGWAAGKSGLFDPPPRDPAPLPDPGRLGAP